MATRFRIFRGEGTTGEFHEYTTEVSEGMVVLDAVFQIQAAQQNDLAVRWNCKAGKCGSCSAEINGVPKLMCMTRMNTLPSDRPVTIEPMRTFPRIKDLVTDVSWNFKVKKGIKKITPRKPDAPDGTYRFMQRDADRVQEFRKCIECFLCQDVCHVLRDRDPSIKSSGEPSAGKFVGPRFMIRLASLEMHPLDDDDRVPEIRKEFGSGLCNITRCCTEVCPEHIGITDNGIIPLKERVVDRYFDPVAMLGRKLFGIRKRMKVRTE
jgi:succinate dehydrogenase / fumarate reductase iron-sulfur subunit